MSQLNVNILVKNEISNLILSTKMKIESILD